MGSRLDRALAAAVPDLSRARIQALIAEGAVSLGGASATDPAAKARAGVYRIAIPPPAPATPEPEAIPLSVLFEDADLIVIDKPAGMAAHPAPGSERGTLVNALLAHCGGRLSGIGGVARPGIVHRLDKDTSGVMVAAKTDAAHRGLSALFAAHDIDRAYIALTRGAPPAAKGTIATRIGRSPRDRKKMAVLRSGGREAITHYAIERASARRAGRSPPASRAGWRPAARTRSACTWPRWARPCWATRSTAPASPQRRCARRWRRPGLERQALHAAVLGFRHPMTGEALRFETPLPADMAALCKRR